MVKKYFISIVPLLVLATCAAVPTEANAEPEWYKNSFPAGKLAENEKLPVLLWGTVTFSSKAPSTVPPTSCELAGSGWVSNSGGHGIGQIQTFGASNCVSTECPPGKVDVAGYGNVEKEWIMSAGFAAGSEKQFVNGT